MFINLVKNGIFPITKDSNGNPIGDQLDTGLGVSGTLQGEGKLLGTSCLFIRTSACNLRCAWVGADGMGSPCDTPYSSHHPEKNRMSIDEIVETVRHNLGNMSHIVISGGEPTQQGNVLGPMMASLKAEFPVHLTVETNGTIYDEGVAKYTDLVSMSPKLSSSTPWAKNLEGTGIKYSEKWAERHERLRKNPEAIQQYINACDRYGTDFQLKFVVSTPEDIEEIENDFLANLTGWTPDDVVLMPEGVSHDALADRTKWALEEAIKRGWRFTPRLHIELFGKARAV